MDQFSNTMEIFKILDKSNCRDCGSATCLAFAAAVFQGQKQLAECTHLDRDAIQALGDKTGGQTTPQRDAEAALRDMKKQIETVDLAQAAERLGGRLANGKLTLKVMGKDFSVDGKGNLFSDIHIHQWVAVPVLSYILNGKGAPVSDTGCPCGNSTAAKNGTGSSASGAKNRSSRWPTPIRICLKT